MSGYGGASPPRLRESGPAYPIEDTSAFEESQPLLRHARTASMAPSNASGRSGGHSQEYNNVSATQKMISATLGSLLTSLLVTPLDVVRIRLQSQTPVLRAAPDIIPAAAFRELPPNLGVTACCREVFWVGNNPQFCMVGQNGAAIGSPSAGLEVPGCAVEETQRKTFTSTLDGLRKIARNEGVLTLWRGLSPTLVMAIPANVIYFTGYDWLRYDNKSPINRVFSDNTAPLVSGGIARIAAASVISPIEMFRTRLQATPGTGTGHFKATLQRLHQMTQTQGYSSLWRGLTLTMWRDVPFSALYWWGYESVKNTLTDMRARTIPDPIFTPHHHQHAQHDHTMTFLDSFTAGAISGALAALITTPFDVGKTRQQVFRHCGDEPGSATPTAKSPATSTSNSFTSSSFTRLAASSSSSTSSNTTPLSNPPHPPAQKHPEQLSTPRFLVHIFKVEGIPGLFRGWAARCLKVAPACAIMISSYEVGKKMAGKVNEHRGVGAGSVEEGDEV